MSSVLTQPVAVTAVVDRFNLHLAAPGPVPGRSATFSPHNPLAHYVGIVTDQKGRTP